MVSSTSQIVAGNVSSKLSWNVSTCAAAALPTEMAAKNAAETGAHQSSHGVSSSSQAPERPIGDRDGDGKPDGFVLWRCRPIGTTWRSIRSTDALASIRARKMERKRHSRPLSCGAAGRRQFRACSGIWWSGHNGATGRPSGVLAAASIDQLYNLAQLMLADADLASDAVQEALIAAWRDLRSLRDPDSFRAWLDRVLVRCVYRAAGRERRQVALRQILPTIEDSAPDPAWTLEMRDAIHRAFRGLSAEHRAVLVAHHYLELSDDEAARMLDIPAGTYKSRLHRATAAMRAELDADVRSSERLSAGVIR